MKMSRLDTWNIFRALFKFLLLIFWQITNRIDLLQAWDMRKCWFEQDWLSNWPPFIQKSLQRMTEGFPPSLQAREWEKNDGARNIFIHAWLQGISKCTSVTLYPSPCTHISISHLHFLTPNHPNHSIWAHFDQIPFLAQLAFIMPKWWGYNFIAHTQTLWSSPRGDLTSHVWYTIMKLTFNTLLKPCTR